MERHILTHELQHIIATAEGQPRGNNVEREVQKLNGQIRQLREDVRNTKSIETHQWIVETANEGNQTKF